ncbi:hypothetical protein Dimus_008900 [Dionaea muscipula]
MASGHDHRKRVDGALVGHGLLTQGSPGGRPRVVRPWGCSPQLAVATTYGQGSTAATRPDEDARASPSTAIFAIGRPLADGHRLACKPPMSGRELEIESWPVL